jgi:DNA (cytosine-5)-methyltransferase 1
LLAGCAPCQPFSKYRLGKSDESDGRWNLLQHFQRLVSDVKPLLVTMENVPRLAEQEIFAAFVLALEQNGYFVTAEVARCADYGVPQHRERLVLLASLLGPLALIPPTHSDKHRTVRQAIAGLPVLAAGEIHPLDPLHQACSLSPTNFRRIKASKPGGTWRDWNKKLVAACHKKKSGKTYPGVYGRMCWDDPAPTMTTQFFGFGNGRFGHPDQHRAISLREGAVIQSFPKNYRFTKPGEPIYRKTVGRLIGNAVPVKLGNAIGRSIRAHVEAFVCQEGKPAPRRSATD